MVTIDIHQTQQEFANLEKIVGEIRRWLDAGPDTREGRGNRYTATMDAAGMNLLLHVKRDEEPWGKEKEPPPALQLEEGGEYNDYVLNAPGAWIAVGNLVVHIGKTRDDWGINVGVYARGQTEDDPIDSMEVPFREEA